ncbi:C1 family peptidase [Terriglobus roseus]|uniref:Xylellain. Cysteine peptidase. MEROPS family C01A n=1 Tax=Terriglobus roseus TaxID=392734 RepID=A0A1H4RM01_9BACT|nr:C1 family peptidase [Terriglobus roseus]SEC32784.1 xylellain. Cysteine peptidase. MEROPS family C01A [Terriglobus roseus]
MSKAASTPKQSNGATTPAVHTIQKYGWVPDLPDQRDFLYAAPAPFQKKIPSSVDLSGKCPPVYDQGQLGSCTANAIAAAIEFDQKKRFVPSRLFIYYNERVMEGTVASDSGAQIRDGIKSVATQGAPPETDWPYEIGNFSLHPPAKAYSDAKKDMVSLYQRLIQDLNTMKGCLASGYPFVFGFTVYSSFESEKVAKTGIVPMPDSGEKSIGGHAVMAVGYDDATREFKVRNSWGPDWGLKGYFKIPYAYLTETNLASDFWTIRGVSQTTGVAR